jgi:hypothetical protein
LPAGLPAWQEEKFLPGRKEKWSGVENIPFLPDWLTGWRKSLPAKAKTQHLTAAPKRSSKTENRREGGKKGR